MNAAYLIAGVIVVVISVAVGLGGLTAYFYKGKGKETTNLWKDEVDALTLKCDRLTQDMKDMVIKHNSEIKELTAQNAGLTARVETLSELISQAPQIKELAQTTAKQHKEVIDHLIQLTDAVVGKELQR